MCCCPRAGGRGPTAPLVTPDTESNGCCSRIFRRHIINTNYRNLLSYYIQACNEDHVDKQFSINCIDHLILKIIAFCSSKLAVKTLALCLLTALFGVIIGSALMIKEKFGNVQIVATLLIFSVILSLCLCRGIIKTLTSGDANRFWTTNTGYVHCILEGKETEIGATYA